MVGRTVTSPRGRRPSPRRSGGGRRASTSRVKPATRRPAVASRLLLGAALGQQRGDEPRGQLGRARPAAGWCTPTTTTARARDRASPRTGPPPRPRAPQLLLVAVGERVGSSSRKSASAAASSRTGPVVRPSSAAGRPPAPDQPREVEVEERVEGRPLGLPLDQRRGVRVADHVPVVPAQRAQRGDGVEVLGERDREPGGAQRLEEARCAGRAARRWLSRDAAAAARGTARSWSEACLSTTPRVSATAASSRSPISSATRVRAQSIDSAIDGAFFSSSSRSRADRRRPAVGASRVVELGHLGQHDLPLALGVGVVQVQVEAAPLERLGQLAGRVGGEHDERPAYGRDRAELGDRHLEVREHLQQQPLDLDVGLVDLVDEQHRRLARAGSRSAAAGSAGTRR